MTRTVASTSPTSYRLAGDPVPPVGSVQPLRARTDSDLAEVPTAEPMSRPPLIGRLEVVKMENEGRGFRRLRIQII